jgi:GWxTD domain-containing protein
MCRILQIYTTIFILVLTLPGVSPAQQEAVTPYQRGQRLYEAGDYEAAASVFRDVLRHAAADSDTRYWLGMSYYRQLKIVEAKGCFRHLTGPGSTDARAFKALGMVFLKESYRAFEALDAFREAVRLAPDDADGHYWLGMAYLTMMGRGPIAEHPFIGKAKAAFEKAQALDPDHPDAGYQLGQVYEGAAGEVYLPNMTDSFYEMGVPYGGDAVDLMSAIAAYKRQIKQTPDHKAARRALATVHSRLGNHTSAMPSFRLLVKEAPEDTELNIDLAMAYWRAKDWPNAQQAFELAIEMLPEKEHPLYKDFSLFVGTEEAETYEKSDSTAQEKRWQDFFEMRDPVPLTPENERLIEHYARVTYARRSFSGGKFPWDRRGDIVIRYGLPDYVHQDRQLIEFGDNVHAKGQQPNSGESWLYQHLKDPDGNDSVVLTFENIMASRQYDYPPIFPNNYNWDPKFGTNATHPYYISGRVIEVTPEQHVPREMGLPFEFVYDPVAFRDEDGRTRLEIAYGIPAEYRVTEDAGMLDQALDMGVVLYGRGWKRVLADSSWSPLFRPSEEEIPGLAIAVQVIEVPPGDYLMAVQAHDRLNQWYGVRRDSISIPDFTTPGLQMSGIRLATRVPPEVEDPDLDVRTGDRLAPNPAKQYLQGAAVHFYLEVYNLEQFQMDQSRYQIDIAVRHVEPATKDRRLIWRLLSDVERVLGDPAEQQTVTMVFEQSGEETEAIWSSAISTDQFWAGLYTLSVAVTDLISQQTVAQTQVFEMVRKR